MTARMDLADRYACALFDSLVPSAREAMARELATLDELLATNESLIALSRPTLTRSQRINAITGLMSAAKTSDVLRRFAGTVAANGRWALIRPIIKAFGRRHRHAMGIQTAYVTTAHTIDNPDEIISRVREVYGETAEVVLAVDPAIGGGVTIRVGSQMVDGSVRTRLANLRRAIEASV
ncbi:MAG: FoF1 ATP synthase subunit delta [Pseudomonadota bacterium]